MYSRSLSLLLCSASALYCAAHNETRNQMHNVRSLQDLATAVIIEQYTPTGKPLNQQNIHERKKSVVASLLTQIMPSIRAAAKLSAQEKRKLLRSKIHPRKVEHSIEALVAKKEAALHKALIDNFQTIERSLKSKIWPPVLPLQILAAQVLCDRYILGNKRTIEVWSPNNPNPEILFACRIAPSPSAPDYLKPFITSILSYFFRALYVRTLQEGDLLHLNKLLHTDLKEIEADQKLFSPVKNGRKLFYTTLHGHLAEDTAGFSVSEIFHDRLVQTNIENIDCKAYLQSHYLNTLDGIRALPGMPTVTHLYLPKNKLSRASLAPLAQLPCLRWLNLSENNIAELSPDIALLTQITSLVLAANQLRVFPSGVYHLTNLQNLSLTRNYIAEIPSQIDRLTKLKTLYLDENELAQLPAAIAGFTQLTHLYVRKNLLQSLPLTELTYARPASLTPLIMYVNDNPLPQGYAEKVYTTLGPDKRRISISL